VLPRHNSQIGITLKEKFLFSMPKISHRDCSTFRRFTVRTLLKIKIRCWTCKRTRTRTHRDTLDQLYFMRSILSLCWNIWQWYGLLHVPQQMILMRALHRR